MDNTYHCETLILLIGSNPLPNYITTRILKPRKVLMMYTFDTKPMMERLQQILPREYSVEVLPPCPVEATKAESIRGALRPYVRETAHLNYTGGTKVMAAQARMAFHDAFAKLENCSDEDKHASYLDDSDGCLRFDDGYEIFIDNENLCLSLPLIAELHGIRRRIVEASGVPTDRDATEVLARVLHGSPPELKQLLNNTGDKFLKMECSVEKALEAPLILASRTPPLSLSVDVIPGKDWTENRLRIWSKFLCNGWLELWVSNRIRELTDVEPIWSVECFLPLKDNRRRERQFEIDVGFVYRHRLFVISCTTNRNPKECKQKLFEVAQRARQLGGDLARSAIVSFLDGSDENGQFVDQVQQDVEGLWDAPNKPKVFGLLDVQEWFGLNGKPNLESIESWLNDKE